MSSVCFWLFVLGGFVSFSSKSSLSPARRRLLELMQAINFGRIENMVVCNGEPLFDPRTHIVREHKLGGDNGPHPEVGNPDFCLKPQVVDLWDQLDQLGTGVVESLVIKHGLPFQIVLPEVPA